MGGSRLMSHARSIFALLALGLSVGLAGCGGTKPDDEDAGDGIRRPRPADLYAEIPWSAILTQTPDKDKLIEDDDVNFDSRNGEDAERVAHWVKQRRDAVTW